MISRTSKELLEQFRAQCKARGLSITPQRTAIYEALISSQDHPRTEDIYNRVKAAFPDMSIDTVYRTLCLFAEIGFVHLVEGYGEAKRYDPDTERHHHFRCMRCGRILDFTEPRFDALEVPERFKHNCAVSNIKVVLEGVCDQCLQKTIES